MTQNYFIPAATEYQNRLIQNVQGLISIFGDKIGKQNGKAIIEIIEEISGHVNAMKTASDTMLEERKLANKHDHAEAKAFVYCDKVKPYFDEIRYHADKLELLVDDELWPLPKFREMLFTR
jgi:glutamine synthetase